MSILRIKNAKKNAIDGVLFLQGVFKRDCKKIEDFLTDKLLGEGHHAVYDHIPIYFTGLDTHPKTTNLLCWNCCRSFKTRPWFEPQSIDPHKQSGKICISIKGNFCSPNCVRRHINTYTLDLYDRLNKISMLKIVYEIFNGRPILDIQPAPPHTDMIQFGGSLNLSEYQKKIDEIDIEYENEVNDSSFANICKNYMENIDISKF